MAVRGWRCFVREEKIIAKIWHSTKSCHARPHVCARGLIGRLAVKGEEFGIPQNRKTWLESGTAMRQLYINRSGGSRKAAQGINRVGD
jgi:hypothetical protein